LIRLRHPGFVHDFAAARGLRHNRLGWLGPRVEDFEKLTRRDLRFASSSIGFALGLLGFVLALGVPGERKMGVGLALFGFVWVRFGFVFGNGKPGILS
jgi:hypothetical protein